MFCQHVDGSVHLKFCCLGVGILNIVIQQHHGITISIKNAKLG